MSSRYVRKPIGSTMWLSNTPSWPITSHTRKPMLSAACPHLLTQSRSLAISVGAVLAVLKMPPPVSVLQGSAIGVQIVVHEQRGMANAGKKGTFLFSPSCEPQSMNITMKAFKGKTAEFCLICDPDYRLQGSPRPPFPIIKTNKVLSSENPVPYDLN